MMQGEGTMTLFELSMGLGVVAVLYVVLAPIVSAQLRYSREEELTGRPVSVRTTHQF